MATVNARLALCSGSISNLTAIYGLEPIIQPGLVGLQILLLLSVLLSYLLFALLQRSIHSRTPLNQRFPRPQLEDLRYSMKLVKDLEQYAGMKYPTPAQFAWLAPQSFNKMLAVMPVLGATTAKRVRQNAGKVGSTSEGIKVIEGTLRDFDVIGDRYHPVGMTMVKEEEERKRLTFGSGHIQLFSKDHRHCRLRCNIPLLLAQSIKGGTEITTVKKILDFILTKPQSAGSINRQRKLLSLIALNGHVSTICHIRPTLHSKTNLQRSNLRDLIIPKRLTDARWEYASIYLKRWRLS